MLCKDNPLLISRKKYLVASMADTPTKSALNKKKVAELRGELTELGLPTNGIKADLVQVQIKCVK